MRKRIMCGFGAVLFLCLLAGPIRASAPAELNDAHPVRVSLVADVDPAAVGEEFSVGVLFELAPGWHIYWTYPGNTGRPTRVRFSSDPEHTKVLEPRFPAPRTFDSSQIDELSFGYADSALVTANAMVVDLPKDNQTRIQASCQWLACKHACVTGRASPSLTLAVAERAKPSAHKARIDQASAGMPATLKPAQAWLDSVRLEDGQWDIRYALPGLKGESIRGFIPRWSLGGACKIVDFGMEFSADTPVARVRLKGTNCLPAAGGLVLTGTAQSPGKALAFAAHAAGPDSVGEHQPPVAAAQVGTTTPPAPVAGARAGSLWLMLLFAFLGGMLLNVMPCVIPVVVPKILHVVRTAQKSTDPVERRRLLWSNSLAYTAGVLATLLSLGVLVLILKRVGHEVGWGFQFQNPWFLVFMISLLLVLGLGMLHVYPLKGSAHTEDLKQLRKMRRKSPVLESFATGLLVTFLGTPCTAPFLGPALGYAFTASSFQIMLFLLTVGLGLSFPFLLLGAWTGWARILPSKVTERYNRIMRGMAFLLFGTAVWLLGVMADGYGSQAAINLVWFLLALGLASWIFGVVCSESDPWRKRLTRLAPLVLLVGLFGWWVLGFPEDGAGRSEGLHSRVGIAWQPFNESEVTRLRTAGKTVFIDFTAEWCMNCKANERLVIETEETRQRIEQLKIAALKGDATRHDPVIQRWLKRFGRAGVPMYLIFPACAPDDKAILLPEILTPDMLQDALNRAGPSRAECRTTAPAS